MNEGGTSQLGKPTGRWNGLAIAVSIAVLVIVAFLVARQYLGPGSTGPRPENPAAAAIGGPFSLVDQHGRTVTDADFRGKYLLVYFGFTFCPDVCPTALTRTSEALTLVGDKAENFVPILITVDPERDTTETLREYTTFFHPRLVALTGTAEQIAAVAKAYRVYYAKVEEQGAAAGSYLMDHTAITYLMGRDGSFLRHFSHGISAERMAESLAALP
jgi:protein SCO1/2